MNWGVVFSWTIVVLEGGAAVGYAFVGDWKRTCMWACWALATVMVTTIK